MRGLIDIELRLVSGVGGQSLREKSMYPKKVAKVVQEKPKPRAERQKARVDIRVD